MKYVLMIIPVLFLIGSILLTKMAVKKGAKAKNAIITQVLSFFCVCIICTAVPMIAHAASNNEEETAATQSTSVAETTDKGIGFGLGIIGAALVTSCSCIAGGLAVASGVPAAIAATSENEKSFGKSLILVAMAEGLPLYGVLISIIILTKF